MTTAKKILLIDDDESILLAVSRVLTVAGFEVVSAPGGVPGLEMARKVQPDAVVCDVNMPDMDGFEVLRRVRADGETVSLLSSCSLPRTSARTCARPCRWRRRFHLQAVQAPGADRRGQQVFEKRARLTEIFSSNVLAQTGELRNRYQQRSSATRCTFRRGGVPEPDRPPDHADVLFTDIRSFTRISERLPATAVAEFLTAYCGRPASRSSPRGPGHEVHGRRHDGGVRLRRTE